MTRACPAFYSLDGSTRTMCNSGDVEKGYIRGKQYVNTDILLEDVVPKPMRYKDIPRTVQTQTETMAGDPLADFLENTPDRNNRHPVMKAAWQVYMHSFWARFVASGGAWTVNGGESFIIRRPPPSTSGPTKPPYTLWDTILRKLNEFSRTKQQRKRWQAFGGKMDQAVEQALGNKIKDMYEVTSLATTLARQGHGYASALVRMITDQADAERCATWLASSNIAANTGFYNSLGFKTVYRFWVGKDDPTWHKAPVPIDVMVREPKTEKAAYQSDF